MGTITKTDIFYEDENLGKLNSVMKIPKCIQTFIVLKTPLPHPESEESLIREVCVSTVLDYKGGEKYGTGNAGSTAIFEAHNGRKLGTVLALDLGQNYDSHIWEAILGHEAICLEIVKKY